MNDEPLQATPIIDAIYREPLLPEHNDNPLINALPPFVEASKLSASFGRHPLYHSAECQLPIAHRLLLIGRLRNYLEPLQFHEELIDQINTMVRDGYVNRSPARPEAHKSQIDFYRKAQAGALFPINPTACSTAPSSAVYGTSGMGKTSIIEQTLSFLPQALRHEQHGKLFQIVWLKLDCPPDGLLKQFLLMFLAKVDHLLGTRYLQYYGRSTTDMLIVFVARVAALHRVGLIVIDEVQHLLEAKGQRRDLMLNFFVTMANEVQVPILTVGTIKALELLPPTMRGRRRNGENGTIIWNNLKQNEEWFLFLDGLFESCLSG
jgi:hypothetical protein